MGRIRRYADGVVKTLTQTPFPQASFIAAL